VTNIYAASGAAPTVHYAHWASALAPTSSDILPVIVLEIIGREISSGVYVLLGLAGLAYTVYNRWYLAGTTGRSLGKRALNLRLISEQTGQPIGPVMAFLRDICHFIDSIACFVGWLFPLWDAKRQTFADKIVGSVVVPA